jgi:predicted enzyme related to lactoylglutathione lyase
MITGVHALFYTTDPEGARAFIRDKLRLPHYDAHEGWLLFEAPAADIGCHPTDDVHHAVSFFCDDLQATVKELESRGVTFVQPIEEQDWGFVTAFELPGGGPVQLYQPKYQRP